MNWLYLAEMRQKGFTLIELLVVIAIISILASVLLSVLSQAREKGRSAQCLSNLRQWGVAFRMYGDDNQDYLPRRGQGVQPLNEIDRPTDWFNALPIYFNLNSFQIMVSNNAVPAAHTQSVFVCPTAESAGTNNNPNWIYYLPYGMNMNLCPWNLPVQTEYSQVVNPACVVAMADTLGPYASTFPSPNAYGPVPRHAGKVNLLFLTGNVQSFAGWYVGCNVGDPHRADVSWLTGTKSDASVGNYQ
jgi:prepilin-type N-terminal cleavage/methylation domain-containing protein